MTKRARSWKTTVGGLVAAIGHGLAKSGDQTLAGLGEVLEPAGIFLMGLWARDNDKSSEDVGATEFCRKREGK